MAHDVFISHSSKDKATADAVCAVLESQGIRCWIAPRDIMPGRDWGASIVGAIKGAKVMVLIFSGYANESEPIKLEVERAVHKGIPIIPLRIENIVPTESLELFLGLRHWLDAYTPPLEHHLNYLARVVREIIGGAPTTVLPTPAPAEHEAKEKAEAAVQAEKKAAEDARIAEENRKRAEAAEAARRIEEERLAAESLERERMARAKAEEVKVAEEKRKAVEAARAAEEQRKAVEIAEQARRAEEQRLAAELAERERIAQAKAAEEKRAADEKRKAAQESRATEEQRKAAEIAVQAHRAEEERIRREKLRRNWYVGAIAWSFGTIAVVAAATLCLLAGFNVWTAALLALIGFLLALLYWRPSKTQKDNEHGGPPSPVLQTLSEGESKETAGAAHELEKTAEDAEVNHKRAGAVDPARCTEEERVVAESAERERIVRAKAAEEAKEAKERRKAAEAAEISEQWRRAEEERIRREKLRRNWYVGAIAWSFGTIAVVAAATLCLLAGFNVWTAALLALIGSLLALLYWRPWKAQKDKEHGAPPTSVSITPSESEFKETAEAAHHVEKTEDAQC